MILTSLHLYREHTYLRSSKREMKPLKGTAEFTGSAGKVELHVSDEAAARIVELCADGIVEAAQQTAKVMAAAVIENHTLLEDGSDE